MGKRNRSNATKVPVSARLIDDRDKATLDGVAQPVSYDHLYEFLMRSPEMYAAVTNVVDDIFGEGYELIGDDAPLKKAQSFVKKSFFNKKIHSWLLDAMLTGDGYLGVSRVEPKFVAGVLQDVYAANGIQKDYFYIRKQVDDFEFVKRPIDLYNIKSSTITIDHDDFGNNVQYIQRINGQAEGIYFTPEEVAHYAFNSFGDSFYGLTPNACSLHELIMIFYVKNYAGQFFENAGVPDYMFILKDEPPNGPGYKAFSNEIKNLKRKHHKSVVFTGNVDIKEINKFNKDLEFGNLIQKLTELYKEAWGLPDFNPKGSARNVEGTERYYKKINRIQQDVEDLLNTYVFDSFNVKFRFKRVYKRDENREADIVSKLVHKPVLSVNEGRAYLGYEPKEGKSFDEIPEAMQSPNPTGDKTPREPVDETEAADRRQEQSEEGEPRGEGKMDFTKNSVFYQLDWMDFVNVVEASGVTFSNAKIMMQEEGNTITLYYNDGRGNYLSVLDKSGIKDLEGFMFYYLRNAVKIKGILEVKQPSSSGGKASVAQTEATKQNKTPSATQIELRDSGEQA